MSFHILMGCWGNPTESVENVQTEQPKIIQQVLADDGEETVKNGADFGGLFYEYKLNFNLNLERTKNKIFCQKGFTKLTVISDDKNVSAAYLGKYEKPLLPHVITDIDLSDIGIPDDARVTEIKIDERKSYIATQILHPDFSGIQLGYLKYHISNSENEYYIGERLEPEIFPYIAKKNLRYYIEDIAGQRNAVIAVNPIKRIFRLGGQWFMSYYSGEITLKIETTKNEIKPEYELLIIAEDRYIGKPQGGKKLNNLADYASWKESACDTKTKVISLSEIFGNKYFKQIDKVAEIKKYIQAEYEKSGFKYLFLVGSFEEIPSEVIEIQNISMISKIPSDFLYSDTDTKNEGYTAELRVGRLPVINLDELQKYLSNVKDYTENTYDNRYYNRYLFAMGVANEMVRCHLHSRDMVEEIKKEVVEKSGTKMDIDFYHIDSGEKIKSVLLDDINKFLSEVKPTFFDILDHGTVYDIAGNLGYEFKAKVPWMLYSVACDSFEFTNIYSAEKNFYQHLLYSDNSKCFAFIGNTDKSITFPCKDTLTNDFSFGVSHEFHLEFVSQLIRDLPENERTIGNLFMLSKNRKFYLGEGRDDFDISFHSLNLCGDPSIVLKRSK